MSSAAVDLSQLQQTNFGNNVTGFYDPGSNTYYDSGGNSLSAADLAQYGAFTLSGPGQSLSPSVGGGGSPSGSGSGGALSGLTSIFSTIGNAIVNGSRPQVLTTPSGGTLVYNPATGGYTTTAAVTAQSALNPIMLLIVGGLIIWLIVREVEA